MTTRIALVTLLAALVLPSAVAQADNPKLVAVVGTNDAFVISLRDANGNAVTQLAPGTYDIAVSDRSEAHNFHLKGPGVDMSTPVGEKKEITWTVTIGEGRYTYVCDAHSSQMRGYFLAGAILSSVALLIMPNSSALWMAAGLLWILDASINISMEPFRAFVADLLPE